jgi:lysophospholipase L1-like esterase
VQIRRRFRDVLAALAISAVVLATCEAITRLADPALLQFRGIRFAGDVNSPILFMTDPILHWRLRPDVEVTFAGVRVRTDANGFRGPPPEEAERTVLILGDSVAFGFRVDEEESFASRLADLLNHSEASGVGWRTLNAAVPGYSSFQVRMQAEDLIHRFRPDYVVVCVGNNEAWPTLHTDREVHEERQPASRLVRILLHSRFLVWLKERIRPDVPRSFKAEAVAGAGPRVGREEYVENIAAIAAVAEREGARLLIAAPPVNLYFAPHRLGEVPDFEASQKRWAAIMALLEAENFSEASRRIDAALAEAPGRFDYLWLKGLTLALQGRVAAGEEVLEQAFENHVFAERFKRSYRQALQSFATRNQISFVDLAHVLHVAAGEDHLQGLQRLYLDWCHPTPEGHATLAEALARLLTEAEARGGEPGVQRAVRR